MNLARFMTALRKVSSDGGQGALSQVGLLLDGGEPPLRLLSAVRSQVRTWLWVKANQQGGDARMSDAELATVLGMKNPKQLYYVRGEVRGVELAALRATYLALFEVEEKVKKGRMAADAAAVWAVHHVVLALTPREDPGP